MLTSPNPLAINNQQFIELIERELKRHCREIEQSPRQSDRLSRAIRYCLLAPGKRIRPVLVLTANSLCHGDVNWAIPAACAVEMIHNYSLIHDDLPAMDDDDLRRGRPTCHVQFDEATAILAGDALIPLAFEVIAREIQPAEVAIECVKVLAQASGALNLVAGQADDLQQEFQGGDLEKLEQIHHRKTGALLSASLELGAVTAQTSPILRESLVNYGRHLGLAFQIADDLLDLRGSATTMGKRSGKDSSLGKLTYPSLLGEQGSEQRAKEMVDAAVEALTPFGEEAGPLVQLAHYVINRNH